MFRTKYAKRKVLERSDVTKLKDLDFDLFPYGFSYNPEADYFLSLKDSWQRRVGYTPYFDKAAATFSMIFDFEPIYFIYDNRHWLIEFWKGQYGITTGAEVGIYVDENSLQSSSRGLSSEAFYYGISDEESFSVGFTLYKNGIPLISRNDRHWWLTGFVLGEFSDPNELTMEISLHFPNLPMRNAFLRGCYDVGYSSSEIRGLGTMLNISFTTPKATQHTKKRKRVQRFNKRNCKRYARATKLFTRTLDKIDYLRFAYKGIYKLISHFPRTVCKHPFRIRN